VRDVDPSSSANAQQDRFWNDVAGPLWVRAERWFDRMLGPHGELAVIALDPQPGERVLDIGCGFGTTTRQVAEAVGPNGSVHGVDISSPMIERARERSAGHSLVSFAVADAQVAALAEPDAPFDAVVSRFGVMFFDDPVAAFTNIRRAVRAGGRLAFVCWQGPGQNPFFALGPSLIRPMLPDPPPPPDPLAPGPMAFADPDRVRHLLDDAGWSDVVVTPHSVPMRFDLDGSDGTEAAMAQVTESELGRLARQQLDDDRYQQFVGRLREELGTHRRDGVLQLDSNIWVVTAASS
jgi:SAM-dependent methyltransferase